MEDENDTRRTWRISWLGSIQEFADSETQRGAWLNPRNDNPHYSFVECMSVYFDDLGLSQGYDQAAAEGLLGLREIMAVKNFHDLAGAYSAPNGDYDQEAVLADPHWKDVVLAAQSAQEALLALLSDADERIALTVRGPNASTAARRAD